MITHSIALVVVILLGKWLWHLAYERGYTARDRAPRIGVDIESYQRGHRDAIRNVQRLIETRISRDTTSTTRNETR